MHQTKDWKEQESESLAVSCPPVLRQARCSGGIGKVKRYPHTQGKAHIA
jgi:hypothetical protein